MYVQKWTNQNMGSKILFFIKLLKNDFNVNNCFKETMLQSLLLLLKSEIIDRINRLDH